MTVLMNRPLSDETPRPVASRHRLWRGMFIATGVIALALVANVLSTTLRGNPAALSTRPPIPLPLTLKNHPASGLELIITDDVPTALRIPGVIELCIGTQSAAVMQVPELNDPRNYATSIMLARSTPLAGVEATFDTSSMAASSHLSRINAWLNINSRAASADEAFDNLISELQQTLSVVPQTDGFILAGESVPSPDRKARFNCGPNDLIVTLPDRNNSIIRMMLYKSAESSANLTPPAPH